MIVRYIPNFKPEYFDMNLCGENKKGLIDSIAFEGSVAYDYILLTRNAKKYTYEDLFPDFKIKIKYNQE